MAGDFEIMEYYWKLQEDKPLTPETLSDEQFRDLRTCHDWRNYVPDLIKDNWEELCFNGKVAVYMMAEEQAHNEEWE